MDEPKEFLDNDWVRTSALDKRCMSHCGRIPGNGIWRIFNDFMVVGGERITVSKEPPKTFYHTFSMDDRIVIICLLSCEKVNVGYSVKSPMDTFDRELGKKIALGRAKKTPLRSSVMDYSRDKGVLRSVAKYWEMKIRKGLIKGTKTKNK